MRSLFAYCGATIVFVGNKTKSIEAAPVVAEKPKADEAPEVTLVRWGMNAGLITPDTEATKGINLISVLIESGWTTLDQIRAEFREEDIPESVPLKYRARLRNAIYKLKHPEEKNPGKKVRIQVNTNIYVNRKYLPRYKIRDVYDIIEMMNSPMLLWIDEDVIGLY